MKRLLVKFKRILAFILSLCLGLLVAEPAVAVQIGPPSAPPVLSVSASPKSEQAIYLGPLHAEEAWKWAAISGKRDVVVAIVDTGVDYQHPDLAGYVLPGVNLIQPSQPAHDDNGHGTRVAGVLLSMVNNEARTDGLVRILPIKALDSRGKGEEDRLIEGMRTAIHKGAQIILLSVGLDNRSSAMQEVIQLAEEQGVLIVAAAGNDGRDIKYPAAFPTVFAVGGADRDMRPHAKSNHGSELDVLAHWYVYTTIPGGGYDYDEGTSMAAPQVAGIAALILACHTDKRPHEIRSMLRRSTDVSAEQRNIYSGYGIVRADLALLLEQSEQPTIAGQGSNRSDSVWSLGSLKLISGGAVLMAIIQDKWLEPRWKTGMRQRLAHYMQRMEKWIFT